MSRHIGPKHRLCRREGVAICQSPKCPIIKRNAAPPGQHGLRRLRKPSEYGMQLREKQKVKRMYGVREAQFEKYFELASKKKASTGDALLEILETRLDNVVFKLNFAKSLFQARQLVSHGHILVNGKKVTIASYNVKIGDIVACSGKASNFGFIKKIQEEAKDAKLAPWLEKKALVGKIVTMPKRDDLKTDINESLIIEYYSR